MRIFKNKFILSPLIIVLVFIFISIPCIDAYDDTLLWNNVWDDFDNFIEKTDTLFLGSSGLYYSVIPDEYDKIMKTSSYNSSAPTFGITICYYKLNEILKRNKKIKQVFLELEYNGLFNEQFKTVEPVYNALKRINTNSERMVFLFHYVDFNNIGRTYGHAMYVGKDFLLKKYVRYIYCIYKKVTTGSYPIDKYDKSNLYCKGYVGAEKSGFLDRFCPDYSKIELTSFEEKKPNNTQLKYLYKIINICKENNIELTLLVSPVSDYYMLKINNMDFLKKEYEKIAEEYDLKIFDVNLLKNKSIVFTDEEDFFDDVHISDSGAQKYTKLVTDYMNNKYMSYFDSYKSVNQFLQRKYNSYLIS